MSNIRILNPTTEEAKFICGLTKPASVHDRRETQLAYEATYYPNSKLRVAHKVHWHKELIWTKQDIEDHCNEDRTEIYHPKHGIFTIKWEYNNIPTVAEWEKLYKWRWIDLDFRISPLIKDGGGRVVILRLWNRPTEGMYKEWK